MSRKYWSYHDKTRGKVRIPRVSFRRNGPRNVHDPLAAFQTPPTWHYTFIDEHKPNH